MIRAFLLGAAIGWLLGYLHGWTSKDYPRFLRDADGRWRKAGWLPVADTGYEAGDGWPPGGNGGYPWQAWRIPDDVTWSEWRGYVN